jgi:hypothetical protein
MSILTTDLIAYGALNRPVDDVALSGNSIDIQNRPVFTQLLANSTLVYSSSGADTRTVTCSGRNAAGALVAEQVTLNGVTAVSGAQIFERILVVALSASGAQTLTVGGSGVGNLGQVPANEKGFYCMFINSASQASPVNRYEKIYWKNTNATLTLTAAQIQLTADPSSKISIGLEAALNDATSVANRLTVPGGISFVGVGVAQNVPTNQVPAGSACAAWIQQSLLAGDAPLKSTFTTQLSGTSV